MLFSITAVSLINLVLLNQQFFSGGLFGEVDSPWSQQSPVLHSLQKERTPWREPQEGSDVAVIQKMGDGAGHKIDLEHVCILQGFPEVIYGEKLVEK